jgi:predicted nucleotidyltransferase
MARLAPEGKVVFALWDAPARFGRLKVMTGLSGAWLDLTLKRLHRRGLIEYDVVSKTYAVKKTEQLQAQVDALMPVYLSEVAIMVTDELVEDERVQAVILFGSVAVGKATYTSDIDLLIVLKELDRRIEDEFNLKLSELGYKFGVAVEPTLLSREDFEATITANVGLIFGLARGHEVLYDRTSGVLIKLLEESVARVRSDYSFVWGGEVWLPKRELTAKV